VTPSRPESAADLPNEEDLSRDDLLAIWDQGEPVGVLSMTLYRHSTTCAVTATGHRGPCTCGAER
jgi:hypothetical protein